MSVHDTKLACRGCRPERISSGRVRARGWPGHADPEVKAALQRLRNIWDEIRGPAKAFRVLNDGTVVVSIHPYRERVAQYIRGACHPARVRVDRMDLDDDDND
jgi:hypothetical protein